MIRRSILCALQLLFLSAVTVIGQDSSEAPAASDAPAQPDAETVFVAPRVGEFLRVNGLENWEYTLDISDYPDGKYNLIVRGVDKAGNEYFTPAIDVMIDQASDRPVVGITNPTPSGVVRGNLNILGTATDDDDVDRVEISIDGGEFHLAEGTEFWSYYLDTKGMPDGAYEITARATDVNGVAGDPSTVRFNLDNAKPAFEFTSHENGQFVNGRISITGVASDSNGIISIRYGFDRNTIDKKLRFSSDRSAAEAKFELRMDTREAGEGAHVYWFEATDKTGSIGVSALLLFIDNEAPEIEILYPTAASTVNGKITVVGRVSDGVGVSSLTAEYDGREPVDIELSAGNPYWKHEFDFTGSDRAVVLFTATDETGNSRKERFQLPLDRAGDRPIVSIMSPVEGERTSTARLTGFVTDDDGVEEIIFRLDKGEERRIATVNAFDVGLPPLDAGEHKITVRAVDINGVEGPEATVVFTYVREAPSISFVSFSTTDGDEIDFVHAAEVDPRRIKAVNGRVEFRNPRGVVSYTLAGGGARDASLRRGEDEGTFSFSIPLPAASIPYGFVELTAAARDGYGLIGETSTGFLVTDLTRPLTEDGIEYLDARLKDGEIDLSSPLTLRYYGFPLVSVVTEPETPIVRLREAGGVIEVDAAQAGVGPPIMIRATSDRGTEFTAGPFVFRTDFIAPDIELDTSVMSGRIGGPVVLSGVVTDDVAVKKVFYRIGKEDYPISLTSIDSGYRFEETISAAKISAEGTVVRIVVVDEAGNTAVAYRTFSNAPRYVPDAEATADPKPLLSILFPEEGAVLFSDDLSDGALYVSGIVTGVPSVGSIVFSLDSGEERRIAPGEVFELRLPALEPGMHRVTMRATSNLDVPGNSVRVGFEIASDPYEIELATVERVGAESIPFRPGMILSRTPGIAIVGTVSAGRSIRTLSYSIDEGDPASLRFSTAEDGSRIFSIPVRPSRALGRHDIAVTSTDEYGKEIVHESFFYLVEPVDEREIRTSPGVYYAEVDPRNAPPAQPVLLEPGDSLHARYAGRPLSSVAASPETEVVVLDRDGDRLTVRATRPGVVQDFRIVATSIDGEEFASRPITIVVDSGPPSISIDKNYVGVRIRDSLKIGVSVEDDLGIARIETAIRASTAPLSRAELRYRAAPRAIEATPATEAPAAAETPPTETPAAATPPGTSAAQTAAEAAAETPAAETPTEATRDKATTDAEPPAVPAADSGAAVLRREQTITLSTDGIADGPVEIWIRVTDESGKTREIVIPVLKDSTPPAVIQLTPPSGDKVNGLFTLALRAVDDSPIESIGFSDDGETFVPVNAAKLFSYDLDLAGYEEIPDVFLFSLTDAAGNTAEFIPALDLDLEKDRPVVDMQLPEQNSVIRSDFIVSGMVFDDDGVAEIRYSVDGGEFIDLDGGNSFEIPIRLDEISDNEHIVEVEAFDLGGVRSAVVSTSFIVSKESPVSSLLAPSIKSTVRGVVTISGEAFDANGIEEVFLSFDNGNTFNRTAGTESWSYTFDTRTLIDGTYSLLIRAVDSTGSEGLYTSLLNVDNTPPEISLAGLFDGQSITDTILLQGGAEDSIGLEELYAEIEVLENGPQIDGLRFDLETDRIVLDALDVSSLPPGWYNLRMTAVDRARNVAYVSRNWRKIAADEYSRIDILFPAPGERLAGEFAMQGRLKTTKLPDKVAVYIDGELFEAAGIGENGYFSTTIAPELLEAGKHSVRVETTLPDGAVVSTPDLRFVYEREGAWIRIDTFSAGDFASDRPWVHGRAGYFVVPRSGDPEAPEEGREIQRIEYSLDNGRTFRAARGRASWQFRLETLDLPDETLNIMVRAVFRNGERAVAKTQVLVDDTDPSVTLLSPEEGMRFNDTIRMRGAAFDANGLREVAVQLRKGGKGRYEVPSFIQGLYLDARVLGATFWEAGAGLTFFDNNVKLQVQVGMAPPGRFSGFVVGAKLLANIALLPYSVLTQDLAFLSSSLAIGATFSYFTMSEGTISFGNEGLVLAAVIGQLEIARFDLDRLGLDWPVLKALSLYAEGQLWFISSDVQGGVASRLAFGIRSDIF